MTSSFYRGAQGVIVVFDCTKVERYDWSRMHRTCLTVASSFNNVRRWFDEVERNACEDLVQVLCAAKIDLADQRCVAQCVRG
jgi:Ras-related protein Rab-1A